ncbi:uncharacterized protein LOC144411843 [Styela clava]
MKQKSNAAEPKRQTSEIYSNIKPKNDIYTGSASDEIYTNENLEIVDEMPQSRTSINPNQPKTSLFSSNIEQEFLESPKKHHQQKPSIPSLYENLEKTSLSSNGTGNVTTILKSSASPKPQTKQRVSFSDDYHQPKESTDEKEDKNKKAFEAWLSKKRKSISKQKEECAEMQARMAKLKSRRYTSMSMTFDEWLKMKNEEAENVSPDEHPTDRHVQVRKRNSRFQKTYDEWMMEKERSLRQDMEKRRSVEMEQKLKEEHEAEAREKEYNRRMDAWRKKKEQMKKNEQERQERIQQMKVERANLEYEEWLSKPRVKTFDEWKKSKTQDSKLNEVSKAQKVMIEEHEQEMEEMRQQIAKEKFHQWVLKKDIGKLKASEMELEQTRNRRIKRDRLKRIREGVEE